MTDLFFAPCIRGISAVSPGESLSAMYFGRYLKKCFVFEEKFLILIVVLCSDESYRSASDFFGAASLNDKYVTKGVKITKIVSDTFVENKSEGNLWDLSNIIQFHVGKGLYKDFIFIKFAQKCDKVLKMLPSFDLTDSAFKEKAMTLLESYFVPQMQTITEVLDFGNDLRKSCSRITNVITESNNAGRVYIWPENGRDYLLNVSDIHLLGVINFVNEKCVMLSYLNGKLVFIFYTKLIDYASTSVAYLAKKLVFIKKFDLNGCAGFVWSDGIDLYLSKVDFHFNKPFFVKLVHLHIMDTVEGIKTVLKCKQHLLVVTLNNSYCLNDTNKNFKELKEHFKEIKLSSTECLVQLHKCALKISQLKKDIKVMEEYLKNKEVVEGKNFNFVLKESEILLKSKVKEKLDKKYWKVRLSTEIKNKQIVEVKDFEGDLVYGMTSKIESDIILGGRVKVNIIGDFGNEFKVLLVKLGCIEKDIKDEKIKTITKNLCKVAKNRKTNLMA